MGQKRFCGIASKSIFTDEIQAKIWAANQKYDTATEPYKDPRCGHIHLRSISKRKRRWRKKGK